MPELPDIELYRLRLEERLVGKRLTAFRPFNPFVLRSVHPAPAELAGLALTGVERIGKRLVLVFEGDFLAVIHLMIAGRLEWSEGAPKTARPQGKIQLAAFDFEPGRLVLREASPRKRAGIHLLEGREGLFQFRRGGLDLFTATPEAFAERLRQERRTLKRVLTSPALFDGIGNAYSDEILFAARLSPLRLTTALDDEEVERLRRACVDTLGDWRERLKTLIPGFPKRGEITAFRPEFAVHGRYGQPCPVCQAPVQHIIYAENETNYCAGCQNEGRLLADRALSRLLKDDWPKTLEELVGE